MVSEEVEAGEAFVVELLLTLPLRLALEALWLLLLLNCSSIGFGCLWLLSSVCGLLLCSWLVEATLWDFFSMV